MKIHTTAREFAIKHHINLGRYENGYYYIGHGPDRRISRFPTAKSAILMMKVYFAQSAQEVQS